MDLFITNMHFLMHVKQIINWWIGVVWITFRLLWCFYQLFGLSFWWHPFTAEDPLLSKRCNATFLQICSEATGQTNQLPGIFYLPSPWSVTCKAQGGFRTPGDRRVCRSFLSGGGVCWSLCRTLCSCLQSTLAWVNLHAPQNTDYCKHLRC